MILSDSSMCQFDRKYFVCSPAILGKQEAELTANIVSTEPDDACSVIRNDVRGKIALIKRYKSSLIRFRHHITSFLSLIRRYIYVITFS
jgi:hypothetical protein